MPPSCSIYVHQGESGPELSRSRRNGLDAPWPGADALQRSARVGGDVAEGPPHAFERADMIDPDDDLLDAVGTRVKSRRDDRQGIAGPYRPRRACDRPATAAYPRSAPPPAPARSGGQRYGAELISCERVTRRDWPVAIEKRAVPEAQMYLTAVLTLAVRTFAVRTFARRRIAPPISPKPAIIIVQLAGSGTVGASPGRRYACAVVNL